MKKTVRRKVELPLADSPINYYARFTIPLSIAFVDEGFEDYFQTAYLQINARKNGKYLNIYTQQLPSVKNYVELVLLKKHMNADRLLKHVVKKIDGGSCAGVFLDNYYLKNKVDYNTNHYAHREYIYGYDLDSEEFLVIGYTMSGQLENFRINFQDFKKAAYEARKRKAIYELTYYTHKKNAKLEFDFNKMYKGIKSYYESRLTLGDRWRAQAYHIFLRERITLGAFEHGLESHKYLAELVRKEFNEDKQYHASIKICGFYDFKKCMLNRMKYLQNNGYVTDIDDLISDYSDIVKQYEIFKNIYVKYSITNNAEALFRVACDIEMLVDKERDIIGRLLAKMEEVKKRNLFC